MSTWETRFFNVERNTNPVERLLARVFLRARLSDLLVTIGELQADEGADRGQQRGGAQGANALLAQGVLVEHGILVA